MKMRSISTIDIKLPVRIESVRSCHPAVGCAFGLAFDAAIERSPADEQRSLARDQGCCDAPMAFLGRRGLRLTTQVGELGVPILEFGEDQGAK